MVKPFYTSTGIHWYLCQLLAFSVFKISAILLDDFNLHKSLNNEIMCSLVVWVSSLVKWPCSFRLAFQGAHLKPTGCSSGPGSWPTQAQTLKEAASGDGAVQVLPALGCAACGLAARAGPYVLTPGFQSLFSVLPPGRPLPEAPQGAGHPPGFRAWYFITSGLRHRHLLGGATLSGRMGRIQAGHRGSSSSSPCPRSGCLWLLSCRNGNVKSGPGVLSSGQGFCHSSAGRPEVNGFHALSFLPSRGPGHCPSGGAVGIDHSGGSPRGHRHPNCSRPPSWQWL